MNSEMLSSLDILIVYGLVVASIVFHVFRDLSWTHSHALKSKEEI